MACVESVENKATKAPFPGSVDIGKRVSSKCQEAGLIVRPIAHLNILSPSLVITREEIDFCVDTLAEAMIAVGKDLGIT